MKVNVFNVTYRQDRTESVIVVGAPTQALALALALKEVTGAPVEGERHTEIMGVSNGPQDVLIGEIDPGLPAPEPVDNSAQIAGLESELKAAKEAVATLDEENTAFAGQVLQLTLKLTQAHGDIETLNAKLASMVQPPVTQPPQNS